MSRPWIPVVALAAALVPLSARAIPAAPVCVSWEAVWTWDGCTDLDNPECTCPCEMTDPYVTPYSGVPDYHDACELWGELSTGTTDTGVADTGAPTSPSDTGTTAGPACLFEFWLCTNWSAGDSSSTADFDTGLLRRHREKGGGGGVLGCAALVGCNSAAGWPSMVLLVPLALVALRRRDPSRQ